MRKVLKGEKDQITLTVDVQSMCDYGKVEPVPIELTFKKVANPQSIFELYEKAGDKKLSDLEAIKDHLLGWKITYDDDTLVEFTEENIELVMAVKEYKDAIITGFNQVQLGYDAVMAKN